jgi:hypothetical protein
MVPMREIAGAVLEKIRRLTMNSLRISAMAITAALLAAPALAQGYGARGAMQNTQPQNTQMQNMQMQSTGMQGLHEMPATVTSVNKSTGMVDVNSEGMSLRLHFPPTALTNVKTGDRIKVQMGLMKT